MTTIYSKLAKAKLQFSKVLKDSQAKIKTSTGGEYSYKYATLENVIEAIQKPLIENGLDFIQKIDDDLLETLIVDVENGETLTLIKMKITVLDTKMMNSIQSYGSGVTYLRRYSLMTAFGLATEDEDATNANLKAPKKEPVKQEVKQEPIDRQKLQAEIISLWAAKYKQAVETDKGSADKIEGHISNKFAECEDKTLIAMRDWLLLKVKGE